MNILKRHVSRASQLVVGEVYLLHGISSYKETIPPQLLRIREIHHDHILPYIVCDWWANFGLNKEYDPNRQIYISDLFKSTLELEHIADGKKMLGTLNADVSYQDIALSTPTFGNNGR